MRPQASLFKVGLCACGVLVSVGVYALAQKKSAPAEAKHSETPAVHEDKTELVASQPETLRLPAEVAKTLEVKAVEAAAAPPPAPLRLEGSLFLDPNRLTHVHTRFPGEVVEIGTVEGLGDEPADAGKLVQREVRFNDEVQKGQLLAVIWSKDLGEKKSELVDCLSRLFLDQETQARLMELYNKGAIPERSVREAERNTESDLIAVARAERTLAVYRISPEEIAELRAEAKRIHERKGQFDEDLKSQWARVEVRASINGVVVEKNVVVGAVVDTSLDLFKIADLTRLDVLAHAYEEDLPMLEDLPGGKRHWNIYLKSDPQGRPLDGSFNQIGNIIDPNQHTALVMGWVDNATGRLRVGQFITAAVDLPAFVDEVAIPVDGLVDENASAYVFVQSDPKELNFTRRKVVTKRRRDSLVYLSSNVTEEQKKAGFQAVKPGEIVVVSGGLELANQLDTLEAEARIATATK
jgi:membrane fusion protein, heavy metal efflux system